MTKLEICNLALLHCGQEKIVALTDSEKRAKLVNDNYAYLRDKLQAEFAWSFMRKRAKINKDGTAPLFGFAYRYALPTDCLFPIQINQSNDLEYQEEQGYIIGNFGDSIELVYAQNITDETKFTHPFSIALSWELAHTIVFALVQSKTIQEKVVAMAETMIPRMRSRDSARQGLQTVQFSYMDIIRKTGIDNPSPASFPTYIP